MILTIKELKILINEILLGQPYIRNVNSPSIVNREKIKKIKFASLEDEIADHLLEPNVNLKDIYGPVPPNAEKLSVHTDPYVRYSSPLPTPNVIR